MKQYWFLIVFFFTTLLLGGCAIAAPEVEEPLEEPITGNTSTPLPTESQSPAETPQPTSPPLATYTPTSEPLPEPTATEVPEQVEELTGSLSIYNVNQLEMTMIVEQTNIRGVTWFVSPTNSVGFWTDPTITIFQTENAQQILVVDIPEEYYVYDISPTGNLIACTDDFEQILLLDATTLEKQAAVKPETFVANVHFNHNGTKIIITSMDEMIAIEADALTGEIIKTHSGFSTAAPVYDAVYDRYTDNIVWFSRGRLQLQNPISEMLSSDFSHEDWINSFAISPDGEFLAVATSKTMEDDYSAGIQLWHIATGQKLDFLLTENMPGSLFYTPDGSLLIGTNGEKLTFWNGLTGELVREVSGHIDSIYKAVLSPSGDEILTTSYDGQTILWTLP